MASPVAAAAGAKAVESGATAVAKKVGLLERLLVNPAKKMASCTYACAAKKVSRLPAELQERIAADRVAGVDTAATASRRFWKEQRQLCAYRVQRFVEESCHVFSGAYFRDYGVAKAVQDLRFLTQAFFIFLMAVLIGRRTVYPPIKPDSPFVLALEHKENPNY
eukprot:gene10596-7360_t